MLDEVRDQIRNVKVRKASRCDLISNRIPRRLNAKALMALTNISTAILRRRYFLRKRKATDVIALPNQRI